MALASKLAGMKKAGKFGKGKVEKTMHEFKEGTLHSGSDTGPKVTDRKQAVAIALSQQRKADGQKPSYRKRTRLPARS